MKTVEAFLVTGELASWIVVLPLLIWGVWILSQESFDELNSRNLIAAGLNPAIDAMQNSKINDIRTKSLESSRSLRKALLPIFFALSLAIFVALGLAITSKGSVWIYLFTIVGLISAFALAVQRKSTQEQLKSSREIEGEIPAQIQLIAILISAGMSPTNAIATLSTRSNSTSAQALRQIVMDIENGYSIVAALDRFKMRFHSIALRRFSTSLILGIERGSSLTPILVAQVRDARLSSKSEVLKKAGKAEIALMIPVVFLILPISILFALWPSYQQLGLFV